MPPEKPANGSEGSSPLHEALLELFEQNLPNLYERIEEAVLGAAFRYCEGNQLQTARLLGISRNVVRARLIQFGHIPGTLRSSRSEGVPSGSFSARRSAIRIGYQRLGALKLVRARGRLESDLLRRGLRVEWVDFASGMALVEAFRRGEVGLGVMGEGPPVIAHATQVPIVYLAAEGSAPEGEAIIVPAASSITRVADLRGKRIALTRGANVHYLLIQALEEAGLEYTDVQVEFLAPVEAEIAFANGLIDAWVLSDPTLAEVQQGGGARVLRDARGLASNAAYYVCTQAFAAAHPEVLEALLAELSSVSRWTADYFEEAVEAMAPRLGIAKEVLAISLLRSDGARLVTGDLIASQQRVADSFFKARLIPKAISVADAAWSVSGRFAHEPADVAPRIP